MLIVRSGVPEDAEMIVNFQLAMAWETEELRLDREIVQRGVKAVFDDPKKGAYWIAEKGGETIGCALTVPEWSDWRNGTVMWIHSVFVVENMRRIGAFRAIYSHLKKLVEEKEEYKGLRLYVEKTNTRAQKVYDAMNMTDEHYTLYEWLK